MSSLVQVQVMRELLPVWRNPQMSRNRKNLGPPSKTETEKPPSVDWPPIPNDRDCMKVSLDHLISTDQKDQKCLLVYPAYPHFRWRRQSVIKPACHDSNSQMYWNRHRWSNSPDLFGSHPRCVDKEKKRDGLRINMKKQNLWSLESLICIYRPVI